MGPGRGGTALFPAARGQSGVPPAWSPGGSPRYQNQPPAPEGDVGNGSIGMGAVQRGRHPQGRLQRVRDGLDCGKGDHRYA